MKSVWEHLDFWATCLIFVTSAMFVPRALGSFSWADGVNVVTVFAAALVARGLILWGIMPPFSAVGVSHPLSHGFKLVLWWGGMRGAVTIALALAAAATTGISAGIGHLILSTAIGYVMATLVINGLTLRPLINLLALDKLGEHDQAIRSRIYELARRRIAKELNGVASHIGQNADSIIRIIMPPSKRTVRFVDLEDHRKQHVAIETWCHHEHEAILTARERGVVSRHNADVMRRHADQLQSALRNQGIDGYRDEIVRLIHPPVFLRMAFLVHRALGWSRPLGTAVADRIALLLGQAILLRELVGQADETAEWLFGAEAATMLRRLLGERLGHINDEVNSLENVFPEFTVAMREKHIALMALGLLEKEFRRHLSEATISAEVFEDLDTERRSVAARYSKRPTLDVSADSIKTTVRPVLRRLGIGRPGSPRHRSRLGYHGERIDLGRYPGKVIYLIAGTVEAADNAEAAKFEEGTFLSAEHGFEGCRQVGRITAKGYVHLIVLKMVAVEKMLKTKGVEVDTPPEPAVKRDFIKSEASASAKAEHREI